MIVELIVHFPQQSSVTKRKRDCLMDVPYLIPGGVVPVSAALASPPLLPDSKALVSESDSFARSASGSCGVDPGPVSLRILTFSVSSMGDSLYDVRKRLVLPRSSSLMFSIFAMQSFTAFTVRGGGTDFILMRPRKGSLGSTGVFEGIAPSSV